MMQCKTTSQLTHLGLHLGTHANADAETPTWDRETSLRVDASSSPQVDSASLAVVSRGRTAVEHADCETVTLLADAQMGLGRLARVEARCRRFLSSPLFCAGAATTGIFPRVFRLFPDYSLFFWLPIIPKLFPE